MTTKEITNLKRYLAKWELDHLRRHAAEIEERLAAAEESARYEREVGDSWREDAWNLMERLTEEGHEIGLTKEGEIVVAESSQFIKREATFVSFTDEQSKAIRHLINAQKTFGGTVIAQVWPDGMRVCHINDDESDQIQKILKSNPGNQKFRSAAEAHTAAILRNDPKGEAA